MSAQPAGGRMRQKLRRLAGRWPEALLVLCIVGLAIVGASGALTHAKSGEGIRIAAGEVPPQMDASGAGREAAIIRAALRDAYGARNLEFHVGPFTRHWEAFDRDAKFDAVTTVPDAVDLKAFRSQAYIEYQNGVIYRRDRFPAAGLGADAIRGLWGKRVVAFAGASGIIPQLRENIPNFRSYAEYDDQYVHSVMLARDFVDAVIADRLIVDNYNQEVMGRARSQAFATKLAFDPAFCPTRYHMVFRTDRMREDFDRGLQVIRASGELAKINDRYNSGALIPELPRQRAGCP